MEYNTIFAKSFSRYEQKKLGYGAFIGCLIVAFSFFTMFKPSLDRLGPILTLQLNNHPGLNMLMIEETSVSQILQQQQKGGLIAESEKKHGSRPVCNVLDPRSDFCELNGDIRIQGKSSTIFFASNQIGITSRNETWLIRPYARKRDATAMKTVTEFSVKSSGVPNESPSCNVNHSVPAIVFSIAGYAGNHFHAFSDVLVPLFITSYEFHGEVQFLVANSKSYWISKYRAILKNLSRYEIINIDTDDKIHCFPSTIVGLKFHDVFQINPSRSQNGYSMKDFREFLRSTYSLERAKAIKIGGDDEQQRKPRLLVINRKQTRSFTNEGKIVEMALSLGFEVIVAEPGLMNLATFASIVNSCDVMMGVHGAGLTNFVFLPSNAILIQIVPLAGLEWLSDLYFGKPVLKMDMRYLEYKIREEESSLINQYPLDHAVFKDPLSIHKQGWNAVKAVYMEKQNVKLDVNRFRATLLKALELLHH